MLLDDIVAKLKEHAGKILWLPLVISSLTFILNILVDISDDGRLSEQDFHSLLQGASGSQMIILAVVMALLKLKGKP